MHNWGLYSRRYGLFPGTVIVDEVPEYRAQVDSMLRGELQRQEELKAGLAQHPDNLFRSYKLLGFFDTLALYFQLTHFGLQEPARFHHVPRSLAEDSTISVELQGAGKSSFAPLPVRGGTGHRQIFRKIYRTLPQRRLARVHLGRDPFCRTVLPDREVGERFPDVTGGFVAASTRCPTADSDVL